MFVCVCVRLCLSQSFQGVAGKDEAFPDSVTSLISTSYDPVYKFHQGFLKEVEQRLAQWSVSPCLPIHKRETPFYFYLVINVHILAANTFILVRKEVRGHLIHLY